jgi:hypothetical protein
MLSTFPTHLIILYFCLHPRYLLVLAFLHGVLMRLADDVSDILVGSFFKGQATRMSWGCEDGTDQEFRNVVSEPHPHRVKTK